GVRNAGMDIALLSVRKAVQGCRQRTRGLFQSRHQPVGLVVDQDGLDVQAETQKNSQTTPLRRSRGRVRALPRIPASTRRCTHYCRETQLVIVSTAGVAWNRASAPLAKLCEVLVLLYGHLSSTRCRPRQG